MNNVVAVLSVVHPGIKEYISEFLDSLSRQTDKDFTLFLINDGLIGIEKFLLEVNFPVKVLNKRGRPAALRKEGIQWVISEGAKIIIFADSDDYFANNRVEISRNLLVDYDVVCNEVMLIGKKISRPTPMFKKLSKDKMTIVTEDIISGNCLGLSNTAIRVDKISALMKEISDDVIAFDWDFFALCIHAGANVTFTKNTKTYYRQHGDNIASPCSFSEEQILRGVRIKRDHYDFLSKFYGEYTKLAEEFKILHSLLESDVLLKKNYCKAVCMNATDVSMWWESIKTLEEFKI